jgi:polysaccharide export outer membrane protein
MRVFRCLAAGAVLLALVGTVSAQTPRGGQPTAQPPRPQQAVPRVTPPVAPQVPAGVTPPPDYRIGPDDILTVIFWRDKDMSGDVAVRPDGKISLPLVNDVDAAGSTPDQLRARLEEAGSRFLEEPNVTVVVKQINSRKVFITGEVAKPGAYPLTGPTTVLQLISMAGGLQEYANRERIVILRTESGKQMSYRFNYKEVSKQKKLQQNIELHVGDTVVVP